MSQLPLIDTRDSGAARDASTGEEFLRILRLVVDRFGLKQAAGELDCSPSFLANCISGRGTNHLRAEWVPWLVRNDVSGDALRFLADLSGMDVIPQKKMTAEEELAALKQVLAEELGAGMLEVVKARARRMGAR